MIMQRWIPAFVPSGAQAGMTTLSIREALE